MNLYQLHLGRPDLQGQAVAAVAPAYSVPDNIWAVATADAR